MSRHIVIVSDDPDKGGVADYSHRIALALVAAGYRVSMVLSMSAHPMVEKRESVGVRHWWLSYDTGAQFARTITDAAEPSRALDELKPDLVLFCDCCPISNVASKHAAIQRRIPFVTVVGFVAPYLAQRFVKCLPIVAKQYDAARAVVAVSTENLELLRKLFGLSLRKGNVVFYGVGTRFFEPRAPENRRRLRDAHGLPDDVMVSFTAARLSSVKLHLLQIAAMDYLQARAPNTPVACVWAGDGELKDSLKEQIAKKQLQRHFVFVGAQSDVVPWYDMADCFALTSESEGMPISIMEAMAKELPVAATSVSGIPEELGETGVLLGNPAKGAAEVVMKLADTWLRWSKGQAERLEAGKACGLRARELFREETMIQKTRVIVEEALATSAVT